MPAAHIEHPATGLQLRDDAPERGDPPEVRDAAHSGWKNRATGEEVLVVLVPTPSPLLNASAARSRAAHWAMLISNPPISDAGDWSSASTAACSIGSSKRPSSGV